MNQSKHATTHNPIFCRLFGRWRSKNLSGKVCKRGSIGLIWRCTGGFGPFNHLTKAEGQVLGDDLLPVVSDDDVDDDG